MSQNENTSANDSGTYRIGTKTDIGLRRVRNEDFLGVDHTPHGLLLVVCDGMGGHQGGERASRLAVEVFTRSVHDRDRSDATSATSILTLAAGLANRAVYEESISHPEFRGMGTTLVAALVGGGRCTVLNIGDSRAYLMRDDDLRRITNDHSHVGELVAMGELTEEDAMIHPQRNLITRALGVGSGVRPDLFDLDLREGDRLLLATDGLHGLMSDEVIRSLLSRTSTPERSCDALVEEALARGGVDNVTVALLAVAGNEEAFGGPVTDPDTIPGPGRRGGSLFYLPLILLALAGIAWLAFGDVMTGSGERTLSDSLRDGGELQRYEGLGFDSAAPQLTPGDQAGDSNERSIDSLDQYDIP